MKKSNSNPSPKTKSKKDTSETEKATKVESMEEAANTDCPFTLPQQLAQNYEIYFNCLAPEYANTIILKSPRKSFP